MKKNELLAIALVFLSTVGTLVGILAFEKFRQTKFFTLQLIARAPEHGNWYPRKIIVPLGKEVKILIRNIETVTHGFAIPDFGVAVPEIKAGEVRVVKFTPDKRGTFPFMCTVWCSEHHLNMRGELIVE
ncbi:MAG: cupredoxin domain-containing protein [Candidatus Omnitrophota bacterium]|nr:cupredoxin domain-containing protein [Candidatus Omnitrophota bacterium]